MTTKSRSSSSTDRTSAQATSARPSSILRLAAATLLVAVLHALPSSAQFAAYVIPGGLSLLYLGLMVSDVGSFSGGFTSIEAVRQMFRLAQTGAGSELRPLCSLYGYSSIKQVERFLERPELELIHVIRLLFLWGRTKLGNRNRAFWGGSSYSPLPLSGLRRKGFGRHG